MHAYSGRCTQHDYICMLTRALRCVRQGTCPGDDASIRTTHGGTHSPPFPRMPHMARAAAQQRCASSTTHSPLMQVECQCLFRGAKHALSEAIWLPARDAVSSAWSTIHTGLLPSPPFLRPRQRVGSEGWGLPYPCQPRAPVDSVERRWVGALS